MLNFVGHPEWKHSLDIDFRMYLENKDVTVLRSILFFYSEQKTDLNTIKKYFTDEAIFKLTHDKFIQIHD
jgi:hypothetical protein